MVDIKAYFNDLFMSDATIGLSPYDDDMNFRSYMDGDDYVLTVTDTSDEFYDDELGDWSEEDAPMYEIRVSRIQ